MRHVWAGIQQDAVVPGAHPKLFGRDGHDLDLALILNHLDLDGQ